MGPSWRDVLRCHTASRHATGAADGSLTARNQASIMASATQRPLCGAKVSQYWGKGLSKAQVGIQNGRYGDRAPLPIPYTINHIGIHRYISISPLIQERTSS